ncbi:hypothetical protein BHM03_00033039 [Ensete ventricosum]|nr:hypothetical protein BHM03_00033039 [Ensete ventricosum]
MLHAVVAHLHQVASLRHLLASNRSNALCGSGGTTYLSFDRSAAPLLHLLFAIIAPSLHTIGKLASFLSISSRSLNLASILWPPPRAHLTSTDALFHGSRLLLSIASVSPSLTTVAWSPMGFASLLFRWLLFLALSYHNERRHPLLPSTASSTLPPLPSCSTEDDPLLTPHPPIAIAHSPLAAARVFQRLAFAMHPPTIALYYPTIASYLFFQRRQCLLPQWNINRAASYRCLASQSRE